MFWNEITGAPFMLEELAKAIPVYFSSMLKFIFGPLGGYVAGLNIVTTILATVAGMMTVVLAFTFFGDFLRNRIFHHYFRGRPKFSDRNRKFVRIWRKYGLVGVAALTPLLLTPIGGTLLAVSFGTPRNRLILAMFVSASAWSVIFTTIIYFFGNVFPDFLQ
jgi:hypothetical protein